MSIDLVAFVLGLLEGWKRLIDGLERVLTDNIAATIPWLGPVVPAYMAYGHVKAQFGWPDEMAWVVAGVIEGVGLSAVATAYQLWNYNETHEQGAARGPFQAALATAGYYLVVVITVNVLLDLFEGKVVRIIAQALLSTLSVVAMVILALRSQHARRLEEDERARRDEEKKAERSENRRLRQELKLAEIEAAARANLQKVSENLPKVTEGESETFGKWKRWPEVPDEYKLQIAETIQQARTVNLATYKTVAAKSIMSRFGIEERVAYMWIGYAERDYMALFSVEQLREVAQEATG